MGLRLFQHGRRVARALAADDQGQDLIEYALLVSVFAVAFALVFPIIREQMAEIYQSWISDTQSIWTPPPPSS